MTLEEDLIDLGKNVRKTREIYSAFSNPETSHIIDTPRARRDIGRLAHNADNNIPDTAAVGQPRDVALEYLNNARDYYEEQAKQDIGDNLSSSLGLVDENELVRLVLTIKPAENSFSETSELHQNYEKLRTALENQDISVYIDFVSDAFKDAVRYHAAANPQAVLGYLARLTESTKRELLNEFKDGDNWNKSRLRSYISQNIARLEDEDKEEIYISIAEAVGKSA